MARIIVQTPGHIQREPALQSMTKLAALLFAAAVFPACVELDDPSVGSTEDDITCAACASSNLLKDAGFELGTTWKVEGDAMLYNDARYARTGSHFAYFGATNNSHPAVAQTVTIPSTVGSATLRYYLNVWAGNEIGDPFLVFVCGSNGGCHIVDGHGSVEGTSTLDYRLNQVDLSAYRGQTVTIRFQADEDEYVRTQYMLDDVSLTTTLINSQ